MYEGGINRFLIKPHFEFGKTTFNKIEYEQGKANMVNL